MSTLKKEATIKNVRGVSTGIKIKEFDDSEIIITVENLTMTFHSYEGNGEVFKALSNLIDATKKDTSR